MTTSVRTSISLRPEAFSAPLYPRRSRGLVLPKIEREIAIKRIKDFFEQLLSEALNLTRVTAPIFVRSGTGLNDDLNGVERPVRFKIRGDADAEVEIVHSLAKWKRYALSSYGFGVGEGLYTDMTAIRPDEQLDATHSVYVDQWDWEKVITEEQRRLETLEQSVRAIYEVIRRTELYIASYYSAIEPVLPADIYFVTSEALAERYPNSSPREREKRVCAKHGAVFVIGIGAELPGGGIHDGRAPDYDDWSSLRPNGGRGLNGDILLWNPVLGSAFEISSMGIRVDAAALRHQLTICNAEDRAELAFHRMVLRDELPQSIGGGLGQSRLCMFYLRAAHIGEVAVGVWPEAMVRDCESSGITLL